MTNGQESHTSHGSGQAQESSSLWLAPKTWLRFLDAAIVLALITGTLYYFGWRYFNGFYGLFNIDTRSLSLSTPAFAIAAVETFIPTATIVVYIVNYIIVGRTLLVSEPTSFLHALAQNLLPVLILVWIAGELNWTGDDIFFLVYWQFFALFAALIAVAVVLSLFKFSLTYLLVISPVPIRLVLLWFLVATLGSISQHDGRTDALEIVTGDAPRTIATLHMKASDSWFNGRPMILVVQRDGLYYLSPLEPVDADEPFTYAIPVTEVISVTLFRD